MSAVYVCVSVLIQRNYCTQTLTAVTIITKQCGKFFCGEWRRGGWKSTQRRPVSFDFSTIIIVLTNLYDQNGCNLSKYVSVRPLPMKWDTAQTTEWVHRRGFQSNWSCSTIVNQVKIWNAAKYTKVRSHMVSAIFPSPLRCVCVCHHFKKRSQTMQWWWMLFRCTLSKLRMSFGVFGHLFHFASTTPTTPYHWNTRMLFPIWSH